MWSRRALKLTAVGCLKQSEINLFLSFLNYILEYHEIRLQDHRLYIYISYRAMARFCHLMKPIY